MNVSTKATSSGPLHRDNGILLGIGTHGEIPNCGLLRDRTLLSGAHQGEEAEHPALAGYNEVERLLREGIDIITGGFPCQDISTAGKGAGIQFDESTGEAFTRSGLFGQLARTISLVRPKFAVMENVAALLSRGMGTVLGVMAEIGYDTQWGCISANDVGAPHLRERIWIVAHSDDQCSRKKMADPEHARLPKRWGAKITEQNLRESDGVRGNEQSGFLQEKGSVQHPHSERFKEFLASALPGRARLADWRSYQGREHWEFEPDVGRVANGVSLRVDKLSGLGNAVVPQIPEIIGEEIAKKIFRECIA